MTRKQLPATTLALAAALALLGTALVPSTPLAAQEHAEMAEMMHSVEYLGGRPNSPFSEAVRVGNVLYLSGKLGTVPGEGLVEGGIIPETQQTMRNIGDALERYGSSLDEVVKCTVFLADIADFGDMSRTYMEFFPNDRPARSALAVGGLVLNARVEIECIATIGLPGGDGDGGS
ncbi:RidA family protein [Candidatus Palauibacter irciniicola]|uniref:RidA family protein n=1 Tax=Candidatus Palauibacter irciniicola TaxID=3056733 RepID=UPI003B0267B8